MEKKEYIAPKMDVLEIDTEASLLCSSEPCPAFVSEEDDGDYTGNLW